MIQRFDWRAAALASGVLLLAVAFPLGWLGAHDPHDGATARRDRASWGNCLPYLRDRSMIMMFAARFSCGVGLFQTVHLVTIALSKGFDVATGAVAVVVFGVRKYATIPSTIVTQSKAIRARLARVRLMVRTSVFSVYRSV